MARLREEFDLDLVLIPLKLNLDLISASPGLGHHCGGLDYSSASDDFTKQLIINETQNR